MENTISDEKGMSAVPAADIMPPLPDASVPELTAEDRLVVLLASAAQDNGYLSPEGWKKASEIFENVFAPDADSLIDEAVRAAAEHRYLILQTRLHAALLVPPLSPEQFKGDSRLAEDFASLPEEKAALFVEGVRSLASEYADLLTAVPVQEDKKLTLRETVSRSMRRIPGLSAWENFFGQKSANQDDEHVAHADDVPAPLCEKEQGPTSMQTSRRLEALAEMAADADEKDSSAEDVKTADKGRYKGATSYLRDLKIQRLFPLVSQSSSQQYELAGAYGDAAQAARKLEQAALDSGQMATARALGDFQHLMAEQPFTVVIVGEGKRGKSSLVNALLGRALSPVRESVPETAAVARFRWGRTFQGRVHFLDEGQCRGLEEFKSFHAQDASFMERFQRFFSRCPAQDELDIVTEESLAEFLSAGMQAQHSTARVEVEFPADILRKGLVLVDTPGLNATDPVQNYLAFEECLGADCLIFVLDARRPESASEQELIRQLASSGRAASVIGVVTGVDRLNEEASRVFAMERASLLLETASAGGMEVLGLLEVNAREAMELRCGDPQRDGGQDFGELRKIIAAASEKKAQTESGRVQKILEKGNALVAASRKDADEFLSVQLAKLPDPRHEELLRRHVERLESVMDTCSSQAWSVVNAAVVDMDAWRKEQDRALDAWQERTLLRIMDAANKHADSVGFTGMFRPKNWKRFDEEIVPAMARECLEELLAERRDVQQDWNEKLRQFGQRMQEISVLCLDAVIDGDVTLQSISAVPFGQERWLVNANSLMKKVGLVAGAVAIRKGGGVGLGIVLGNMGWWALLPVAVVGSVAWTLMKLGSPSRCRRILMNRKEEAVRKWTVEQRARLDEILNQNLEDLTSAYGKAVNEGFVPAMGVLAEEASALRAYIGVLQKMRGSAEAQSARLTMQAEKLQKELLRLA